MDIEKTQKLVKILNQLDISRLKLYVNLTSYDDDLENTYDDFKKELKKLKILIKGIK